MCQHWCSYSGLAALQCMHCSDFACPAPPAGHQLLPWALPGIVTGVSCGLNLVPLFGQNSLWFLPGILYRVIKGPWLLSLWCMWFSLWFSCLVTQHPVCMMAYSPHPFMRDINLLSCTSSWFPSARSGLEHRGRWKEASCKSRHCFLGQPGCDVWEADMGVLSLLRNHMKGTILSEEMCRYLGEGKVFTPQDSLHWCYRKSLMPEKTGKSSKWTKVFENFSRNTCME